MAIGKDEVVEVLSDFRIRSIRFSAGPINVNVDEYDRVSDFVDSGAITITPTKGISQYDPPSNTLYLKDGDTRSDFGVRTRVLHECTHVVSDINTAEVTRLYDEAAAYLAQFAFLRLLDPSFQALLMPGDPESALMRVGLNLVEKYGLGQPSGFGAIISVGDLDDLGHAVQRHPEYARIKDGDKLAADGVALSGPQMAIHFSKKYIRDADRARYEAWLLANVNKAAAGSGTEKASGYGQLLNHFLTVFQPEATILLHRLSALKSGDPLSERFHAGLSAQQKHDLLEALRAPKPPG